MLQVNRKQTHGAAGMTTRQAPLIYKEGTIHVNYYRYCDSCLTWV